MAYDKATRRRGNCKRAKNVHQDADIVPRNDWERANRILPLVFGVCFALMCALTIWMGW